MAITTAKPPRISTAPRVERSQAGTLGKRWANARSRPSISISRKAATTSGAMMPRRYITTMPPATTARKTTQLRRALENTGWRTGK